jgi:hypothetical protein
LFSKALVLILSAFICFSFFFTCILLLFSPDLAYGARYLIFTNALFFKMVIAIIIFGAGISGFVVLSRFLTITQAISTWITDILED